MNIKTLTLACKLLPKKKSIMLKGVHGIGKTEWVKSMAKKWKLGVCVVGIGMVNFARDNQNQCYHEKIHACLVVVAAICLCYGRRHHR